MRRLTLADGVYLWRVTHRHLPCAEVFTAYLEGHPRAPLRVLFAEGPGVGREPIGRSGIVVDYRTELASWNLNEPGTARALVEHARRSGWAPATDRRPHVVSDGFAVLPRPPVTP